MYRLTVKTILQINHMGKIQNQEKVLMQAMMRRLTLMLNNSLESHAEPITTSRVEPLVIIRVSNSKYSLLWEEAPTVKFIWQIETVSNSL